MVRDWCQVINAVGTLHLELLDRGLADVRFGRFGTTLVQGEGVLADLKVQSTTMLRIIDRHAPRSIRLQRWTTKVLARRVAHRPADA